MQRFFVLLLAGACVLSCGGCDGSRPVAPKESDNHQQIIDSLQAELAGTRQDLCILRLIEGAERDQLICLREWVVKHHKKVPPKCQGMPIDLSQCKGDE